MHKNYKLMNPCELLEIGEAKNGLHRVGGVGASALKWARIRSGRGLAYRHYAPPDRNYLQR
jgi:hypothetical protein